MSSISNNLKYVRNVFEYKQKEVAVKIGVTPQAYSKYESGDRSITLDMLHRISNFYRVPIYLFLYPIEVLEKSLTNPNADLSKLVTYFDLLSIEAYMIISKPDPKVEEKADVRKKNKKKYRSREEIRKLSMECDDRLRKIERIKNKIQIKLNEKFNYVDSQCNSLRSISR